MILYMMRQPPPPPLPTMDPPEPPPPPKKKDAAAASKKERPKIVLIANHTFIPKREDEFEDEARSGSEDEDEEEEEQAAEERRRKREVFEERCLMLRKGEEVILVEGMGESGQWWLGYLPAKPKVIRAFPRSYVRLETEPAPGTAPPPGTARCVKETPLREAADKDSKKLGVIEVNQKVQVMQKVAADSGAVMARVLLLDDEFAEAQVRVPASCFCAHVCVVRSSFCGSMFSQMYAGIAGAV